MLTEFPFCLCIQSQALCESLSEPCCQCSKPVKLSLQLLQHKFRSYHHGASLTNSVPSELPSLSHFLDTEIDLDAFLLSDKVLKKYHMLLDIVSCKSQRSCCFTKGYAHYVEGTGSVVQHSTEADMSEIYSKAQTLGEDDPLKIELLHQLQLRYFSPDEVTRLMCFPPWFTFPTTTTKKQRYKLLGNSINVLVVASLLIVLVENK